MAQLLGPDASSRSVSLRGGRTAHGRTATVYTDAEATTEATINEYDGTETPGDAITDSQVTIDSDSRIPQFWFPDGVDTLYVTVNGVAGVKTVYADVDRRLDAVPTSQGAAVADLGALTSAQLTGGESPTEAEHNAVQTDVAAIHAKVNALLGSLRTAGIIDT
jgi:hypothetical protein